MFTKYMWNLYLEDHYLDFNLPTLVTGNLLVLITPFTLIFDLFFIIPEIIIYKKRKGKDE